jgi:hypothetical protein
MSESEDRDDPNATIQLDALDPIDSVPVEEPDGPREAEAPARSARRTPPPLSAVAQPQLVAQPRAHEGPPAAPRIAGRTLGHVALIVAIAAVAIAAGLVVGNRIRDRLAAAPAASSATAATTSAPMTPSASASERILTLPTIEMKAP